MKEFLIKSNMKLLVRPATIDDLKPLCELLDLLFTQEADFTPDHSRQEQGLRLIIENPTVGRIYCATESDRIIGMVNLLFTVSTAEGGPVAWLEDMIVHPSRRGQGIGEQLLQTAIAEARSSGCLRITLLTDTTNQSAVRFYTRSGFTPSHMMPLRLKL